MDFFSKKVRAFDRDEDASSRQIVYKLAGQGANKEFTINERTGEIYASEPLDRDPPNGIDQWNFVVQVKFLNFALVFLIRRFVNV